MPDTDPLRLSHVLIPWRLLVLVLDTENDQVRSTRAVFCVVLLTGLSAIFAMMLDLMGTDTLWTLSVIAAVYCAALLTLSFVILNALSMRR